MTPEQEKQWREEREANVMLQAQVAMKDEALNRICVEQMGTAQLISVAAKALSATSESSEKWLREHDENVLEDAATWLDDNYGQYRAAGLLRIRAKNGG